MSFPPSRQINIKSGPIVGRRLIHQGEKQVDAFQGIPYGKAPVGELRFEKPQPVEPWTELRECKQFGPRSIQHEFPGPAPDVPRGEDCLNLNVFTPVWQPDDQQKGFAVFIYVHGGGFMFDSAVKYGDVNICKNLVTKDVVAVTMQYRCGYLGLWSTEDGKYPGNLLLWDLTLALHWIQDNIRFFNGDPNNVTLVGQSAGGCLVDLLSLSPKSRDLFHKVIPMAGNASDFWAVSPNNSKLCKKAAEKFGVPTGNTVEMMKELKKLPAMTFALGLLDSKLEEDNSPVLGPVIDGDFLPKSVRELRKEAPHKPRMAGVAKNEGLMWLSTGPGNRSHLETIAKARFPEAKYPNNFKELRDQFIAKLNGHTDNEDELQQAIAFALGDNTFIIGCQEHVLDQLESGRTDEIYVYVMEHFNEKMHGVVLEKAPFKGASHCSDVSFLLGIGIIVPFEFNEEDSKVVDIVSSYFTNFAKFGNPNGPGLAEWLPATKEKPERNNRLRRHPEMSESFFEGRPRWYIEESRKHCRP